MRISFKRSAALAIATTLASAGIALGTTTAAQAATCAGVTVNSVNGGATIASYSSQVVYLSMSASSDPGITDWFVDSADVYRGNTFVGTIDPVAGHDYGSRFSFIVPNSWGRGAFSVRNLKITSYGTGSGHCEGVNVPSSFRILSAIRGNVDGYNAVHITARGATHKFKVGTSYYATNGKWVGWRGHKLKVQMKKGSHWKTIKTVKLNKKGKGAFTKRIPGKHKFRAVIAGTSTIMGGATPGTKKL